MPFLCYTSTLDRLIALCQQRLDPFSTHVGGSTRFSDLIDNPLHIHGTLSSSLILGVDAEAQIKNLEMRKDADILNYFVKPSINKASGEKRTEACKKIIDQSQYICLYGLSCGDTDQIWWKYILEWLKRGSGNRLVIYMYSNKSRSPSAGRELRMIDQIKYFFKSRACVVMRSLLKFGIGLRLYLIQMFFHYQTLLFSLMNSFWPKKKSNWLVRCNSNNCDNIKD